MADNGSGITPKIMGFIGNSIAVIAAAALAVAIVVVAVVALYHLYAWAF